MDRYFHNCVIKTLLSLSSNIISDENVTLFCEHFAQLIITV